jgi:putative RNA 2'-phosphotransferase
MKQERSNPSERLSRFLTYVLRHRPKEYPVDFDAQGFVSWDQVTELVQKRFPDVTEADMRGVVRESEKKRFEWREGKVRATYGHSFPVELSDEAVEPPAELYFGTARDLAASILRNGLKPRDRQYVHLSQSFDEALAVGRRRDPSPAVVTVDARAAHADGIRFFAAGPLYLADAIPPKYLSSR